MKFSVLLPTRNGAKLLANCIHSILNQEYDDFELVISDNANEDGTKEVLQVYTDHPRITLLCHDEVLSVVENWTAAYEASSGEYVLMMGDDDYLLPGFFQRMESVLNQYGDPDCVLYNGYSYVHPDSISGNQESFWSSHHYRYGERFGGEGIMPANQRLAIVRKMFRFKQDIPLNMQTIVIKRSAAESVQGSVFPPPFPDHYLINALLISADKWVYLPQRLVVVGVSPKSFGHYHYSHQAHDGLAYLGVQTRFPDALPGSELVNGVYSWLLLLKQYYGEELQGIEIDYPGYVRRQVYAWLTQYRHGAVSISGLLRLFGKLGLKEWLGLISAVFDAESWRYVWRLIGFNKRSQAEEQWSGLQLLDGVKDIQEFVEWLEKHPDHRQ
jgi:glycosyltransferase involved in cell wall biosynthesis